MGVLQSYEITDKDEAEAAKNIKLSASTKNEKVKGQATLYNNF